MKIAVLDDYLHLSQKSADWSKLPAGCEVTVFDRPLKVPDEAAEVLQPFDAISLIRERMPVPCALIERLPNLKLICITGYYHRTLDVAAANENGIVVSHTELFRGTYNKATSELAWGLMFAVARHIPFEANAMRSGGWQHTAGMTLNGRTLGLVGLGRQGRNMVPTAKALGMNVIAWSPNLTQETAGQFGVTRVDKDELFATSDVVSLHMVLAESTRNIVSARELALMKPTAILINTARGPLVEERALIDTLLERRIAGAGLDVYHVEPLPDDSPLRTLPNVVLTPHLGYATQEFFRVAYEDTVENLVAFANGTPIRILTPERNDSRLAR
ncbi:MAG: D-2-hydroxyacid dehydrogenase family protein [Burkholderiales bacterium]